MRYCVEMQDPSSEETRYLYEALVEELRQPETAAFEGVFAFASRGGIEDLLQDEDFEAFMAGDGRALVVVGIDAVTNQGALALLLELSDQWPNLEVRVFHNDIAPLFHPKLARFTRNDGSCVMIVGSGNLTPGGLRQNIEAYSKAEIQAEELGDSATIVSLDEFLARHEDRIRAIDDEAMERAARNVYRRRPGAPRPAEEIEETEAEIEAEETDISAEDAYDNRGEADRILVAEVPSGGGRWNQVHFNKAAVEEFFRVRPDSADRAFLYEVSEDGSTLTAEPPRKCIYSDVNKNHKIEFAAHHGEEYPDPPPILVIREVGHHTFVYRMLLGGDQGYDEMRTLLGDNPIIGRGPTARTIVDGAELLAYWPDSPV